MSVLSLTGALTLPLNAAGLPLLQALRALGATVLLLVTALFGRRTARLRATVGRRCRAPNLVFFTILAVVIRYVLKMIRALLDGVASETATLKGFDPEWAGPTCRPMHVLGIVFAIVITYPYTPGPCPYCGRDNLTVE
ncbi:MAG: hypothetical protein JO108_21995 [Acidobacteriaceae bacterium]|nr:hypothetical protein [Acidobacteriaceae bacterium]